MKDREVLGAHPGWAVRFEDGTWLGGAHCWSREDACGADIYDTKEEAEKCLKQARLSILDRKYFSLPAEIVEAWQPLCESLRCSISVLNDANNITPQDLSSITWDLECVLEDLKAASKKK